jgi:DMSO/TMAO reductase YedYZ molybdopterin-dependent catalytic subunit
MTQPDTGAPPRSEHGAHGVRPPEPRPDAAENDDMSRPVQNPGGSLDAVERRGGPELPAASELLGAGDGHGGATAAGGAEPHCAGGAGGDRQRSGLPPGQYIPRTLPVLHYGPIPAFNQETWDLKIFGATESGAEARLRWDDVAALPVGHVLADFHCVTKFTVRGLQWAGVLAAEVLRRYPPAAAVTHVMIWADFGYSANIGITDFAAETTLLATHRDGERLTPEHGYPLRLVVPHLYAWKSVKWIRAVEYLTTDRRGFWEERGYHNTADPWREQRYSYQEMEGEGPPM